MGEKLIEPDEILFRQIHPNYLQDGEPASDRFRPSELDQNKLSIDRSAKITAAAAHALYTKTGKKSGAVYGVTVSEFASDSVECSEDPIKDDPVLPDNDAHALADYSPHEKSSQKLIAKRLKRAAVARGCLFFPQ